MISISGLKGIVEYSSEIRGNRNESKPTLILEKSQLGKDSVLLGQEIYEGSGVLVGWRNEEEEVDGLECRVGT